MGDSTIDKIDNFFNVVDATLEEAGKVVGRADRSGRTASQVGRDARDAVRNARDANPRKPEAEAAKGGADAGARSKVRIIESIDAETSKPTFVITDGISRSECNSRELAERIARAMEVQ